MKKETLLISSCLFGETVRYDGNHNKIEDSLLNKLQNKYNLISFCPEVEGGLPTPRIPCEIISFNPMKILNKNGVDKTKEFQIGANKALQLCKEKNITKVLLKSNSPSCSSKFIYDGTFTGIKIEARGITSELLSKNNLKVYDENEIEKLL